MASATATSASRWHRTAPHRPCVPVPGRTVPAGALGRAPAPGCGVAAGAGQSPRLLTPWTSGAVGGAMVSP